MVDYTLPIKVSIDLLDILAKIKPKEFQQATTNHENVDELVAKSQRCASNAVPPC
jgi:hypothetical protein